MSRARGMLPLWALGLIGCQTGEQAFVGDRLPVLCEQSYATCGVTAGCALDARHYVRGSFPGTRRVVVSSVRDDTPFRVRMFLPAAEAPGTELLLQLYEPDCSLDPSSSQVHLQDVDLIAYAGQDRTVIFDPLTAETRGEHLVELFSDASVDYLLIVEALTVP